MLEYMSAGRVVALGVVVAVLISPGDAAAESKLAPGEPATEAIELNQEAQRLYGAGQFTAAGRTYAQILSVLPENAVNVQERDNVMLLTYEAYRRAYADALGSEGPGPQERAAALLCEAQEHEKEYRSAFGEAYKGARELSDDVLRSGETLRGALAAAEASLGAPPCARVDLGPAVRCAAETTDCAGPDDPGRGHDTDYGKPSGAGLIVAGALTMAAGLGTSSMIIVGGARRREADNILKREASPEATDREVAKLASDAQRAREDRSRANGLIVAGSVVTGLLVAGGATMLGLGSRRRMRYMAFTPAMDRRSVGFSLQGRF